MGLTHSFSRPSCGGAAEGYRAAGADGYCHGALTTASRQPRPPGWHPQPDPTAGSQGLTSPTRSPFNEQPQFYQHKTNQFIPNSSRGDTNDLKRKAGTEEDLRGVPRCCAVPSTPPRASPHRFCPGGFPVGAGGCRTPAAQIRTAGAQHDDDTLIF